MASHLLIPKDAVAFSYASTPLSLGGVADIDIRIWLALDAWDFGEQIFFAHEASGQQSINLNISPTTPNLRATLSANGTSLSQATSPVTAFVAGTGHGVRFTRVQSTGAWVHYTSTSETDTTWTQTASGTILAGQPLFTTTGPVTIGDRNYTSRRARGRYYKAEIRSGINGTLLASPDFTTLRAGQSMLVDGQGNLWSLNNGSAKVWADVGATPRLGEVMQ